MKGFDSGFVHRVMQLVDRCQTTTVVNGEIGSYFWNKKGVRQGDPISPLLFNLIANALTLILNKSNQAGHIKGVIRHLLPGGIRHLQYEVDTMIMIQGDDLGIANLKFFLICFEPLSPALRSTTMRVKVSWWES
jgi:hypothetical protein